MKTTHFAKPQIVNKRQVSHIVERDGDVAIFSVRIFKSLHAVKVDCPPLLPCGRGTVEDLAHSFGRDPAVEEIANM